MNTGTSTHNKNKTRKNSHKDEHINMQKKQQRTSKNKTHETTLGNHKTKRREQQLHSPKKATPKKLKGQRSRNVLGRCSTSNVGKGPPSDQPAFILVFIHGCMQSAFEKEQVLSHLPKGPENDGVAFLERNWLTTWESKTVNKSTCFGQFSFFLMPKPSGTPTRATVKAEVVSPCIF